MTTQKYTITGPNGEEMGFLVLTRADVYEYTTPGGLSAIASDSALGNAALLLACLGGFTGAAMLLPGPDWIAPALGLGLTATLAGLKAWRSGSVTDPGKVTEMTIKVESWSDEGHVLLDEIQDKTISLDDWRRVAKAVVKDGRNFSRPALTSYISQTCYHKIKDELARLNMAHRNGNGYTLSPRGLALLRKISELPY